MHHGKGLSFSIPWKIENRQICRKGSGERKWWHCLKNGWLKKSDYRSLRWWSLFQWFLRNKLHKSAWARPAPQVLSKTSPRSKRRLISWQVRASLTAFRTAASNRQPPLPAWMQCGWFCVKWNLKKPLFLIRALQTWNQVLPDMKKLPKLFSLVLLKAKKRGKASSTLMPKELWPVPRWLKFSRKPIV